MSAPSGLERAQNLLSIKVAEEPRPLGVALITRT